MSINVILYVYSNDKFVHTKIVLVTGYTLLPWIVELVKVMRVFVWEIFHPSFIINYFISVITDFLMRMRSSSHRNLEEDRLGGAAWEPKTWQNIEH